MIKQHLCYDSKTICKAKIVIVWHKERFALIFHIHLFRDFTQPFKRNWKNYNCMFHGSWFDSLIILLHKWLLQNTWRDYLVVYPTNTELVDIPRQSCFWQASPCWPKILWAWIRSQIPVVGSVPQLWLWGLHKCYVVLMRSSSKQIHLDGPRMVMMVMNP